MARLCAWRTSGQSRRDGSTFNHQGLKTASHLMTGHDCLRTSGIGEPLCLHWCPQYLVVPWFSYFQPSLHQTQGWTTQPVRHLEPGRCCQAPKIAPRRCLDTALLRKQKASERMLWRAIPQNNQLHAHAPRRIQNKKGMLWFMRCLPNGVSAWMLQDKHNWQKSVCGRAGHASMTWQPPKLQRCNIPLFESGI